MMKKKYRFILLTVMATLLMALPSVSSAYDLWFYLNGTSGGSISYSAEPSGTGKLTGTNIPVLWVTDYTNDADITGGVVNFTTASYSYTSGYTWFFDKAGTSGNVSIVGMVGTMTLPAELFRGTIASATLDTSTVFKGVTATITDTWCSDTLKNALGITDDGSGAGLLNEQFRVRVAISPDEDFSSYKVLAGSISNTATPIPAAFILFGSGLFGLIAVRRRKN